MIFVRFRRLELRGAGGWLGSTANREHSNGILRSRFCARAKVTIFCTEVTVAQLGLMSDVPNECGADQKVGDPARPALAGDRGCTARPYSKRHFTTESGPQSGHPSK